jgi:hypothetical protein
VASLAEFSFAPPNFWPGVAAPEESGKNRSATVMRRYEMLLLLSRCLASARPEDLVTCLAAELRHAVDFWHSPQPVCVPPCAICLPLRHLRSREAKSFPVSRLQLRKGPRKHRAGWWRSS